MRPGGEVPEPKRVARLLPEHLPYGRLSIAVFGPGRGEAIIVRLPDGAVGVVDGCHEPTASDGGGDPVREMVDAFAKASPDPAAFRLSFVCLTHPHDDHYAGLGRLLEAYAGRVREVWRVQHSTPQYLKVLPEWLRETRAGTSSLPDDKTLKGLERVIERLEDAHRSRDAKLRLLVPDRTLREEQIDGHLLRAKACGPADVDLNAATNQLMSLIQKTDDELDVKKTHDPNLTSSAVMFSWGNAAILLAGDLLRGNGSNSGWEECRHYVNGEIQVVNVAHHASIKAHHVGLWDSMKPRLAIVTPFQMAVGDQPPRPEQIASLASSSVVAITSPPDWPPGAPNQPRRIAASASPRRSVKPKNNAISLTATPSHRDIDNAVAVSLDPEGRITQFILAGEADVYQ